MCSVVAEGLSPPWPKAWVSLTHALSSAGEADHAGSAVPDGFDLGVVVLDVPVAGDDEPSPPGRFRYPLGVLGAVIWHRGRILGLHDAVWIAGAGHVWPDVYQDLR